MSKDRLFFVFDHQTGLRLRSDWQHLGKTKKNGHPERSRRTDYFLFSIIKMVFDYAQTNNTWGKQKEWSSWAYSKDWQHLGKTKKNDHPERCRRTDYFLFSTIKLFFDYAQTDNTWGKQKEWSSWAYSKDRLFFVFDHQTGLRLRSDWQHLCLS